MRLTLEITAGAEAGKHLLLQTGDVSCLGRGADAEIQVSDDPLVSRHHCVFECADAICRIRDLDSSNGTFVNGERISAANVRDGDVIEVGKTRLSVRIEGRQRPEGRPAPPSVAREASSVRETSTVTKPQQEAPSRRASQPVSRQRVAKAPAIVPPPGEEKTKYSARRPYADGLNDSDPGVREATLLAAAWAREPWVLEHCRKLAAKPSQENWDALLLFAILGQPSHLKHIKELLHYPELGSRRFRLLGAFGHPGIVPALLEAIADKDPLTAAAAGAAFTKMTGAEIDSETRVEVPSENVETSAEASAEDDAEEAKARDDDVPLEDVTLPSVDLAKAHWSQVQGEYSKGTRWCRGFDLSRGGTEDVLGQLDMESRWEACLRGRFEGTWNVSLVDLERFPQGRARG